MSIVSACDYKRAKDRLSQILAKKHSSRINTFYLVGNIEEFLYRPLAYKSLHVGQHAISTLALPSSVLWCYADLSFSWERSFFTSAFDFSKPKRKLSNDPMKKFKSDAVQFAHFYILTSCHHESSNSKELFQPFNHFYCIYLVLLCWIFENWNGTKQSEEENNCSWRLCRRYESPRRVPRYLSW